MEKIIKQFAAYKVSEVDAGAWTVSYTLMKDGKEWGTFYHVTKGARLLWVSNGNGSKTGLSVYPSREDVIKLIDGNEKRLAKKAGVNLSPVTKANAKLGDRVKCLSTGDIFLIAVIYRDGAKFLLEGSQKRFTWTWTAISGVEMIHFEKETLAPAPPPPPPANYSENPADYKYIQGWGGMMGSGIYYIRGQQALAVEDKAPLDAIYKGSQGFWVTFDVCVNEIARREVIKIVNRLNGF